MYRSETKKKSRNIKPEVKDEVKSEKLDELKRKLEEKRAEREREQEKNKISISTKSAERLKQLCKTKVTMVLSWKLTPFFLPITA